MFANAGIADTLPFATLAALPKDGTPPPKPNLRTVDIDLIGVIYTIYLATHYLRQNPTPGGKIVATASAAALYSLSYVATYCASKAGVSE